MNILITGASSGIGAALAIEYAEQKQHNLFLFGRNHDRLSAVAQQCLMAGTLSVSTHNADVTNAQLMHEIIQNIIAQHSQIDLVIANAGISAGFTGKPESAEQVNLIFQTNLIGTLNTIQPLIPHMCANRNGHIALMSSMASFIPLPQCPAYSASKAAVRFYAEALNASLAEYNVTVTAICPGYIKTPLTIKNKFYMPFLTTPDKAAKIFIARLAKKPMRILFPLAMYLFIILVLLIPPAIRNNTLRRLKAHKDSL